MFRKYFASFITLFLLSSIGFGMGADHRKGTLPPHDGWPSGIYDAVNLPCRIHGYWINSSDTLFYKEGNSALEESLQKLATAHDLTVQVVLHAGRGVAQSPWSKEKLDFADWTVTISGKEAISIKQPHVKVDVWLGGNIQLDKLKIPENMEVISGNEIENYISNRRSALKP